MSNDDEPLLTFQDVAAFFEKNKQATLFLGSAVTDYAAARCLLLNLHFPGLALGAQAIEKCLKAYILLHDPARKVRGSRHDLPPLLEQANQCFPGLNLPKYAPLERRPSRAIQ